MKYTSMNGNKMLKFMKNREIETTMAQTFFVYPFE